MGMYRKAVVIIPALTVALSILATPGLAAAKKQLVVGWTVAYFDHPVYHLMMKAMKEVAEKEGIKLIVVDRRIFRRGQNVKWNCFVTWDMVGSGRLGGEQVVKALNGKGNLVVVEGTPGAGSTIDRGDAFYNVIKKYPDIKVVYKISADFRRDKGLQVTEDILQRFPKGTIDAIYYMNDEMALGGLQAIKAAGRLGDFKVISVDGEKEAMEALKRGEIDYEVIFHLTTMRWL